MHRDHDPRRRITWRAVLAIHLCCLLFASTLRAQGEGKGENREVENFNILSEEEAIILRMR